MKIKLLTTQFDQDCAYFHIAIKQTAVFDYQTDVTFISILILKAIDSTWKSRRFSSQLYIYKEQKGHPIEEIQQRVSSFFQEKSVFKMNEETRCITNKGKTAKNK